MADHPTPNGADAGEPRERPSWYVPIQPIPEDDTRTGLEVLLGPFVHEPLELSPELQAETEAFLDQFLVPRESSEA